MANERLNELRAQVRARQVAAGRKVRRLENNGFDLQGSKIDPRRNDAPIHRYNAKQLESYLAKLEAFTSRRTQFVADTFNRPISRDVWRKYQQAEARANRKSQRSFDKVKDIFVPASGMTIGQRDAATRSEFPRSANPAVNSPFNKIKRVPGQINSKKALEALTRQQQKKVDPRYMEAFVKDGRKQLKKMLKVANRRDIQHRVDQLTTKQFHILWGYTNAANDISQTYEIYKGDNKPNRADDKMAQDSFAEVNELIDWVSQIPDRAPSKPRKKVYRNTKAGPINLPYTSTDAGIIKLE